MNATALVVSVISIVACLVLALRGSGFRVLGATGVLRYAAIWAVIIVGLVLMIRLSGWRFGP